MDGIAAKANSEVPTGLSPHVWHSASNPADVHEAAPKPVVTGNYLDLAAYDQSQPAVVAPQSARAAASGDHTHHENSLGTTLIHGAEAAAVATVVVFGAKLGGDKLLEAAPKLWEEAPKLFTAAKSIPHYLAESVRIGDFGGLSGLANFVPQFAFEGAANDVGLLANSDRSGSRFGEIGRKLSALIKPQALESGEPMMMANLNPGGGGGGDRSIIARDLVGQLGQMREFTHKSDGTAVQVALRSGHVGIRFGDGAVRQIEMQTPIHDIRVVENGDIKNYHFNGSATPNLAINSRQRYLEAGLHNGDMQFVLDSPKGSLNFTHGDNSVAKLRPGRLEIPLPGGRTQVEQLSAVPGHVQITEHANGTKTFQLAEDGKQEFFASISTDPNRGRAALNRPVAARFSSPIEPPAVSPERTSGGSGFAASGGRVVPAGDQFGSGSERFGAAASGSRESFTGTPHGAPPRPGEIPNPNPNPNAAGANPAGHPRFTPTPPGATPPGGRPPGAGPRPPFVPTTSRAVPPSNPAGYLGRHTPIYGTSETRPVFEEDTPDRYPFWRLNIEHNPDRAIGDALTGIDPRAHIDMHKPAEVAVGQMELPWFMEDFFNKLGRH